MRNDLIKAIANELQNVADIKLHVNLVYIWLHSIKVYLLQ